MGEVPLSRGGKNLGTPLTVALSGMLDSALPKIAEGIDDILGVGIANAATTGNVSILQSIVELFE